MNWIALDLEWNQPVGKTPKVTEPVLLNGEIIQIGAVKLDETRTIVDGFGTLVRPKYYTRMQEHVRRLTGIRESQLKKAPRFPEVYERFRAWCGEEASLIVWGGNDLEVLRSNALLHGLDAGWLPSSIDLQPIYGRQFEEEKRSFALSAAAERFQLQNERHAFHDAQNDAYYTAQIFQRVDWARAMEERQPDRPAAEDGDLLDRVVFTGYPDRGAALKDRKVTRVHCPVCGRRLAQTHWVVQPSHKRILLASCKEHGGYFFRLRFFKDGQGWNAVRLAYPATEERRAFYQDQSVRKRRRKRRSSAPAADAALPAPAAP